MVRWEPEAGRMALDMRGSNRQRREVSATLELKYVFWQQVARFVAEVLPVLAKDCGAVDVLAMGGGQGVVEREEGGGRWEEGTKSGSGGA